jgi:D-3-phosphoglycerate dehydrogenase
MATRAKAFGMKIQYHNRTRLPAELEAGATYVSFDELLANSDVFSLNLALNPSTRHIIGATEFGKMKDGVVIVNTARGALIDENALVAALDSGKVRKFPISERKKHKTDCVLNRSALPVLTFTRKSPRSTPVS